MKRICKVQNNKIKFLATKKNVYANDQSSLKGQRKSS